VGTKTIVRLALLGFLVTTLSGCAAAVSEPVTELAVLGSEGGMCVDGPCGSSFTVYSDGTTSDKTITLDVSELKTAINSSRLKELPEDPEAFCQSYVDGSDLTVVIPAWGENKYTPCRLQDSDSDPLVLEATELVQSYFEKINR